MRPAIPRKSSLKSVFPAKTNANPVRKPFKITKKPRIVYSLVTITDNKTGRKRIVSVKQRPVTTKAFRGI
ncbi:MAG: hypothetical protein NTY48_02875 [Candidatus Diapherotrites archaeon]|nr:hypothetical protein [Candidatus Diapherotrites archaeon]